MGNSGEGNQQIFWRLRVSLLARILMFSLSSWATEIIARSMRRAVEMGIEDRVTWTGMVEDAFGEGVFEAADVVCQFSRWEEVFGWTIAEAMAHGKPVISTRAGE